MSFEKKCYLIILVLLVAVTAFVAGVSYQRICGEQNTINQVVLALDDIRS